MARMVVTQYSCDKCNAVVNESSIKNYEIKDTMDDRAGTLDLCLGCNGLFEAFLSKMVVVPVKRQYKRKDGSEPKSGTSTRERTMPCDQFTGEGEKCDYMAPDLRTLNSHKSRAHGIRREDRN